MLPDPFDVLEATLGPAARVVPLVRDVGVVRVVRTTDRPDHPAGNAVHHLGRLPDGDVATAVADLDRRFPRGRARLVVPYEPGLAAAEHSSLLPSVVEVLQREADAAEPGRGDVQLSTPTGERDWHGITVLLRHAAAPGEDRSRGREDDRLRWWTAGLRELVGTGRARVLRAVRFGTPAGVGVLHWAPAAEVGDEHAGLAVVADLVVHPAHRGMGIARSITEALVELHLTDFPRACVMAVVEQAGGTALQAPPRRWRHHARLLALTRAEGRAGP